MVQIHREVKPNELTTEIMRRQKLDEIPFVCRASESDQVEGMVFPPVGSAASDFMEIVGEDRLVRILQIQDSRELILSFEDWVKLFSSENQSHEMMLLVFDLQDTPLKDLICLPKCVEELDLLNFIGGDDQRLRSLNPVFATEQFSVAQNPSAKRVTYHGGSLYNALVRNIENDQFETVATATHDDFPINPILWCQMATKRSFIDFHIAFGSSATFLYLVSGMMRIYVVKPSDKNTRIFRQWETSKDRFLGDLVEFETITLNEGDCFYSPPGSICGYFWSENSISLGSNFLLFKYLSTHLKTVGTSCVQVPMKLLFPSFHQIMIRVIFWAEEILASNGGKQGTLHSLKALQEAGVPFQALLLLCVVYKTVIRTLGNIDMRLSTYDIQKIMKQIFIASDKVISVIGARADESRANSESAMIVSNLVEAHRIARQPSLYTPEPHVGNISRRMMPQPMLASNRPSTTTISKTQSKKEDSVLTTADVISSQLETVSDMFMPYGLPCHRCAKKRKKIISCRVCRQNFCKKCATKLVEDLGVASITNGCPSCLKLCCCFDSKCPDSCGKENHCFRVFNANATGKPIPSGLVPAAVPAATAFPNPVVTGIPNQIHNSQLRCGICNGQGHQRGKCPYTKAKHSVARPTKRPKVFQSIQSNAMGYKCGHCKIIGHNRSTCPELLNKNL